MQGIRLDEQEGDERGRYPFPTLPLGGYGKGLDGKWYCRVPIGHTKWVLCGNLDNHTIAEHEDGTITAHPSLLFTHHKQRWHGYLERGVWREVD